MSEDKKGSLEGILAATGAVGAVALNSMTVYSLLEKAGVYAQLYDPETHAAAYSAMTNYTCMNLPVAFCAMTGGFVIGKYIGCMIDKLRNKKKLVQLEFDFRERK